MVLNTMYDFIFSLIFSLRTKQFIIFDSLVGILSVDDSIIFITFLFFYDNNVNSHYVYSSY